MLLLFVMAENNPDVNDTIDLSMESMELDKFVGKNYRRRVMNFQLLIN